MHNVEIANITNLVIHAFGGKKAHLQRCFEHSTGGDGK